MDFLDPQKQRRHAKILLVGYVLVSAAILIATVILLELAYGFGLNKNGQVVQNGLLFVSSTPTGASMYFDNKLDSHKTNARLSLQSGQYDLRLQRSGYRTWQRTITLEGDSVEHYDYPFLFPSTLTTAAVPNSTFTQTPGFATQTPDQRWLLVLQPGGETAISEYDLKNPTAAPTTLSIPSGLLTNGTTETLQATEWANDNQHVLLTHTYDGKTEFIMFDRSDPTQSVNLNKQLNVSPTKISLLNKKYDQYYIYDSAAQTLGTANIGDSAVTPDLKGVLAYQSYGSNIMLYAISDTTSIGKVDILLFQNNQTYHLKQVAGNTTYLLNLTQYSGSWYVAIGASSEGKVYVYKNPVNQLGSKTGLLVPIFVLKTPHPTYLSFSNNAQYIMDENGSQFSVFDALNDEGYSYDTKAALDSPQPHAAWMDGNRLTYVSGGKLTVFDYDGINQQTLMPANANYLPFFAPNYKFVDTIATASDGTQQALTTTSLLTPADQ